MQQLYTDLSEGCKDLLDTAEQLDPFDILVADKSWQQREFLTLDESRMLWAIITAWQNEDIGAAEALAWLDNNELLDPDALMTGFVAFQQLVAQHPPIRPPASPLSRLEEPHSGDDAFPLGNTYPDTKAVQHPPMEFLEAISARRAG